MNRMPLPTNLQGARAAGQQPVVEEVLRLTEAMQHATRLSDWREVSRLSAARHPILMSIGPNQPPQTLALIRRIQTMTAEITREAEAAKAELTAEFLEAQRKAQSAQTYLKNAYL